MTRSIRAVAAAIAEPSRLRLLQALSEPASVTELAERTGLRQANVSNHLARLRASGLVRAARRGRLVEYRLADANVAQLVESISVLAGPPRAAERARLGEARTCYDHLAGRVGVALFDGLLAANAIADDRRSDGALCLGTAAKRVFAKFGVDVDRITPQRRRLAYRCLDWTERRPHLGGALGAELAAAFLSAAWVRRRARDRGLDVAPRAWRQIDALRGRAGAR